MTSKELKTMVFLGLAEKSTEAHEYEIYQALDSAQLYLARLLDWRMIPELVTTIEPIISTPFTGVYDVPAVANRPDDLIDLVSLMWESNDLDSPGYTELILRSARITSVPALISSYLLSDDLLCADDGASVLMSKGIGAGWGINDNEITMIYKHAPAALTDIVDPEINQKWHHHMVDYALADIWMKFGDKERSILYNKQLLERLSGQSQSQQPQQGAQR